MLWQPGSDSRAMTFWLSLPETEVVILLNKDMMACHSFSFCWISLRKINIEQLSEQKNRNPVRIVNLADRSVSLNFANKE